MQEKRSENRNSKSKLMGANRTFRLRRSENLDQEIELYAMNGSVLHLLKSQKSFGLWVFALLHYLYR